MYLENLVVMKQKNTERKTYMRGMVSMKFFSKLLASNALPQETQFFPFLNDYDEIGQKKLAIHPIPECRNGA